MASAELASVSVLLDQLQDDSIKKLMLTYEGYDRELLEYLNTICNDQGFDLTKPDSLTLELAELDNKESLLKTSIQKKTAANMDLILSLHEAVDGEMTKFNDKFTTEFEELYENANDQDLNLVNKFLPQQLQLQLQKPNISNSSVILQNIDNLMDILELPLLTLACVKQGHYSESLEISSHSKRLSIRYSDIEIVNKIESDIKLEIKEMLVGLIRLLRTDLKQSSILKIMTYLKRINPSDGLSGNNDRELKLIYLQLRFHYILNELKILELIKKSNVEMFLKRNIEVIREHCFSTLIAFENIFSTKDESLLREFVISIIQQLTIVLRENLPKIENQNDKENLLLQLCYCSSSLIRVGFEFGAVLLSELSKEGVITVDEWLTVTQRKKKLSF